jgi:signal transduction histidine kinase/ActR/RegA family two-component response regulator
MTDPVRAEAIRTLFLQVRNQTPATVVVTLYMVGTAWAFTPWRIIVGWAAAVLALAGVRWMLARSFARRAPPDAQLGRWAGRFTLIMMGSGLLWGLSFLLFAHLDRPITVALTLACLYSIASGSTPSMAYHPPTLYVLVVPIFTSVLAKTLAAGEFSYALLGIASALYGLTMIAFCRVQARTIEDGFRIRFENVELLDQLRQRTAEAEEAKSQAEQASLAKSQFLAAASHDLRQPLYALGLFSSSLQELSLDAAARDVSCRIQDSIGAMESLFEKLLDLSKLEAGVIEPKLAPVDVDALFDRLAQVFRPLALQRGLELRLRSDGEWAWSDAVLLEQALANLVSNAIRWTQRGGVLIAVRRRRGVLRFEVWDTGVGIDPANLRRIFDDYVQLENPERDRRRGLGLGLSIARRSSALIGSSIQVASRRGRGSLFHFEQPASPAPPVRGDEVGHSAEPTTSVAVRHPDLPILLIEDDDDVRRAFSDLLARWGVPLEAVATGSAALTRVAEGRRYGLVISDQRLPGEISGLDLIAALRAADAQCPPVVLITGDMDAALMERARSERVPLLAKPVQPARLKALLGIGNAIPKAEATSA